MGPRPAEALQELGFYGGVPIETEAKLGSSWTWSFDTEPTDRPPQMSISQTGRKGRSVQVANDKRLAILHAARDLVTRVGFREAQMNAVAEEAGVALATLYRNFSSKAELMVEIVGIVSQREVDAAAGMAVGGGSSADRLWASAWIFASRALRGHRLAHALVAEPVEPEIETARLIYRRKLARVFETVIDQGIRDEEFPPQDAQASAACIVGSLFEGLVGPLTLDDHRSNSEREAHAKSIVAFCLRGVGHRGVMPRP